MPVGITWIVMAMTLSACASVRSSRPHELFDEHSGNTLLVVGKPLIFARERTDVAAHARDYATLIALEVDHSGQVSEYLLLCRWSTVDQRMTEHDQAHVGPLRIWAEGRSIDLEPSPDLSVSRLRRPEFQVPATAAIVATAYAVDVGTLRFIAASRQLVVRMPQERFDTPFALWADGRVALAEFVRQVAVPRDP